MACQRVTMVFRQVERNSIWAKIMVVTTNIKLEGMLLHSRATSIVKPGMVMCCHPERPESRQSREACGPRRPNLPAVA